METQQPKPQPHESKLDFINRSLTGTGNNGLSKSENLIFLNEIWDKFIGEQLQKKLESKTIQKK